MATDYGISVLLDSTLTGDQKAQIVKKIIQILSPHTVVPTHAASYVAGSRGDQVTLTVT